MLAGAGRACSGCEDIGDDCRVILLVGGGCFVEAASLAVNITLPFATGKFLCTCHFIDLIVRHLQHQVSWRSPKCTSRQPAENAMILTPKVLLRGASQTACTKKIRSDNNVCVDTLEPTWTPANAWEAEASEDKPSASRWLWCEKCGVGMPLAIK